MTKLPPEIISLIEREANEYSQKTFEVCGDSFSVMKDVCNDEIFADGYLAGATAWAEKCMELVRVLEEIKRVTGASTLQHKLAEAALKEFWGRE